MLILRRAAKVVEARPTSPDAFSRIETSGVTPWRAPHLLGLLYPVEERCTRPAAADLDGARAPRRSGGRATVTLRRDVTDLPGGVDLTVYTASCMRPD